MLVHAASWPSRSCCRSSTRRSTSTASRRGSRRAGRQDPPGVDVRPQASSSECKRDADPDDWPGGRAAEGTRGRAEGRRRARAEGTLPKGTQREVVRIVPHLRAKARSFGEFEGETPTVSPRASEPSAATRRRARPARPRRRCRPQTDRWPAPLRPPPLKAMRIAGAPRAGAFSQPSSRRERRSCRCREDGRRATRPPGPARRR